MRVTLVGINFAPERTGIAPYTTAVARHLAEQHDVTVITGVPHYPDWTVPAEFRRWRADDTDGRLRTIRVRHVVPKEPGLIGRTAYELSYAARAAAASMRVPADVVIAVVPPLFGAHAARLIARRHKVPYGVIVQDIMGSAAAQGGVSGAKSVAGLATKLEASALRSASSIVTIHPRMGAELQRLAGADATPTVIYNWTHVGSASRSRAEARTHFGWRDDQVIALHSGNMGSKQNLEVVVDAARLAQAQSPAVHFVLAGGGNQQANLERYAAGCPNLSFLGGVADADYVDLLQAADVLLVNERPGMTEMSLPSKLTSYLHAGRPVVAATEKAGATGEFISSSGGGIVTPAGQPQQLLDAVRSLAADSATADQLIATGQRFAREHLGEQQALAAYQTWVEELARRKR